MERLGGLARELGHEHAAVFAPRLIRALADEDRGNRELAGRVVRRAAIPIEFLEKALSDQDERIRVAAVKAMTFSRHERLGKITPWARDRIELLLKALCDESPTVRRGAADALPPSLQHLIPDLYKARLHPLHVDGDMLLKKLQATNPH